jgi:hypothetical protein
MLLEGDLAKVFIESVKEHAGHTLTVGRTYQNDEPIEYSVDCTECQVVLISAEVE